MCWKFERIPHRRFCGQKCENVARSGGPMIFSLTKTHEIYQSVVKQFKDSWRHTQRCPTVVTVYAIISHPQIWAKYSAYRGAVETRGQFLKEGRSRGNEKRRWHGTTRKCNLGDAGNLQSCGHSACALCSIIRSSYDLGRFKNRTGWGRFGAGIYTTATSSKANDYSSNAIPSPRKALLLNSVVVGRGYKLTRDNPSLTKPPVGYDSVVGEPAVGGSLNYDELVVYRNDAIRPSYLVIYQP
ncbi:hypothetical protein JAAARDRAFT_180676 [Jaapia argillacea MUCL 33604]|uniref:PARP catalytic domain-containing protein n=1 Tax=Jaapia argillacea MUCL 33604 TaxID=933084 RepID=A0A067PLW1_9AGAM|nr:hypothetical protein JAAARDRAFT_180676 [Jaapia argillacea MUCL 33604]